MLFLKLSFHGTCKRISIYIVELSVLASTQLPGKSEKERARLEVLNLLSRARFGVSH